jgi:hypothetical protein
MCTQINKSFKKYLNGYISAKTKSSKLELMQVQPKMYELILIQCHKIVTTGSYILLDGIQTQHYNLYCHVIQIKLSRANMCPTTKGKNLFIETMNRGHMIVFHRAINHVTESYITAKMNHIYSIINSNRMIKLIHCRQSSQHTTHTNLISIARRE